MRTSVMYLKNSSKRKDHDHNNNYDDNNKKVCLFQEKNNSIDLCYDYSGKVNIKKQNSAKPQSKTHQFIRSITDTIKRSVKLFHYIFEDKFNKSFSCTTDKNNKSFSASLYQDNSKEENVTNYSTKRSNFSNPFSPYVNDHFCLVKVCIYYFSAISERFNKGGASLQRLLLFFLN